MEAMSMSKFRILLLSQLMGLTLFSCGSLFGRVDFSSNVLIYQAPQNTNRPTLDESERQAINDAYRRFEESGGHDSSNSLFCPLSSAIANELSRGKYSFVKAITDKFNVSIGDAAFLKTKNAMAYPEGYSLGIQTKRELYEHGVSVIQGSPEEVRERITDFAEGLKVDFNPGMPTSINYFAVDDSFEEPWSVMTGLFDGKEVSFMTDVRQMSYEESEKGYTVSFGLQNTLMTVAWPKEGHQLGELSMDDLFKTNKTPANIYFHIPQFKIQSKLSNSTGSFEERQAAEFELDPKGARGRAVTANYPTSSNPYPDLQLCVDRPFYFAYTYQGAPLFVGSVVTI